jgi:hypothetical protein
MTNLEDLKKVELEQFDPTPFIGSKALIDEAELKSKEQPDGKVSHYVMFKALVDPTGFNGEPLYATRIVGVQVGTDGTLGWGEKTKMAEFLKFHKVEHPKELIGKQVVVQTQKDSTYLTF